MRDTTYIQGRKLWSGLSTLERPSKSERVRAAFCLRFCANETTCGARNLHLAVVLYQILHEGRAKQSRQHQRKEQK